jgi:phosphoglycerate dehydrogenase-like enzyme
MPNVLLTPHSADETEDAFDRAIDIFIDNL